MTKKHLYKWIDFSRPINEKWGLVVSVNGESATVKTPTGGKINVPNANFSVGDQICYTTDLTSTSVKEAMLSSIAEARIKANENFISIPEGDYHDFRMDRQHPEEVGVLILPSY